MADRVKHCETSCWKEGGGGEGDMLQCATLKKSIKSLPRSFRKVESSSTFCNACGNKKIVRQIAVSVYDTWQFLVQLASQQNCETSCMQNCLTNDLVSPGTQSHQRFLQTVSRSWFLVPVSSLCQFLDQSAQQIIRIHLESMTTNKSEGERGK